MSVRILSVLVTVMIATTVNAETPTDRDFERAARNYRIETYHAFRTNRAEYDLRIEKGNEVSKAWANVQSDAGKQAIYDWFVSATPSDDTKTVAQSTLPDLPKILDGVGNTESWDLVADPGPQATETSGVDTFGARDNASDAGDLAPVPVEQPFAAQPPANPQVMPTEPKNNLLSTFGNLIETAKKSVSFAGPETDETADENGEDFRYVNTADDFDQSASETPTVEGEFDIDELNLRMTAHNTQLAELRDQFEQYGSDLEFVANIIAKLGQLWTEQEQIRRDLAIVPTEFESEITRLITTGELASVILTRLTEFESDPTAFEFEGTQEEFIDQVRQLQTLAAPYID